MQDPLVTWKHRQRHLDRHIGSKAMKTHMMKPRVKESVYGAKTLLRISVNYPQLANHEFSTLIQEEWQYTSRAIPGLETHLQPVEDFIQGNFLPPGPAGVHGGGDVKA